MESHLAKDRALLLVSKAAVALSCVHEVNVPGREPNRASKADPKKMHIYSAETPVWMLALWWIIYDEMSEFPDCLQQLWNVFVCQGW